MIFYFNRYKNLEIILFLKYFLSIIHTCCLSVLKLNILEAKDDEVEFKAYYRENDMIHVLHERSKFVKKDGEWLYDSGKFFNTKVERNESCPCGSGRKYKKCCA